MNKMPEKNSGLGGFGSFVLGAIVFLCVGLIGATGYFKYQLDRSETVLTTEAVPALRQTAQDNHKMWGLSLTLMAWSSLVLAAAMSAGLYLTLRNRQSAPLRALAQSIENLSRGDMQTPIWGMERRDAIGDLARAADLARYHFSQMPDLSLLSDQGPVRIKFEGESRSIFEAMMKNIREEYERARNETSGFTRTITTQQDLLTALSVRLNTAVNMLQQHGAQSDQAMKSFSAHLADSARSLLQSQERTTGLLERLIPYMQERAQNMAEVTHIAGTKVTQSLQALIATQQNLQEGMNQSQQSMEGLAGKANELNERLFAAVNLMQASGKALTETTETTQSRFNEAVETLSKGEIHLQEIIKRAETRLDKTAETETNMAGLAARTENSAERMENAIRAMTERHDSLGEQVVLATHRMDSIVATFDNVQKTLGSAVQQIKQDGESLGGMLKELRTNNEQLLASLNQNAQSGQSTVQQLAERSQSLMQKLESELSQHAQTTQSRIAALATHSDGLAQQAQTTTASLAQTAATLSQEYEKFAAVRTRFAENVDQLGLKLEQQAAASFGKTQTLAEQSLSRLSSLSENVDGVMQRLNMLGQLTGTLGNVAGQLGQLMPSLTQQSDKLQAGAIPDQLLHELQEQWYQTLSQMSTMHDELAQLIIQQKDQLEIRLSVMDKKIKAAETIDPQQTAIMSEIVTALARINNHVMQLEDAMQQKNMGIG